MGDIRLVSRHIGFIILRQLPTYVEPSVRIQITITPFSTKLCLHLQHNSIGDPFQSAYRPSHSVETAIVCIQCDILRSLDVRKHVVLVLFDISAAFDTIDHDLLLAELDRIGMRGDAIC